jgi:hypothetical protein
MLCQHGVDDEKLRHTRAHKTRAGEIEIDKEKENKEKADVRVSADTHSAQGEGPAPAQTDYRSYNNYLKR